MPDLPKLPPIKKKGRPKGSRNLRSEVYAALLRETVGDPLAIAVRIAVKNVLDPVVVAELADAWECSKHEAVKLWAGINRDCVPYLHQRLPAAVVLNPGDPHGERVVLDLGDGDYREIPEGR